MGQHKLKENRNQLFLRENPICIFCGGTVEATTIDHVPPKIVFRSKQWPETFAFAACKPCNEATRTQDKLVGFLARMGHDDTNPIEKEEMQKLMQSVISSQPEMILRMLNLGVRDKRKYARETGIYPETGQSYKDLPVIKVTDEVNEAVKVTAEKITKALYFKHTGQILPNDSAIYARWFTNAEVLSGKSPLVPEVLRLANMSGKLIRCSKPLNDQFDYRYQVSAEHGISLFVGNFGNTFGFVSLASRDPNVLDRIINQEVDGKPIRHVMDKLQ